MGSFISTFLSDNWLFSYYGFSVVNYRLPTAIGMAIVTFVVFVMPIPVLLFQGLRGVLIAIGILLSQILLMLFKKGGHGKWWHALMIPFAGLIMIFIILKSAFKTINDGGIYWRDSFYPFEELKKQRSFYRTLFLLK